MRRVAPTLFAYTMALKSGSVWDRLDKQLQQEERTLKTTGSVPPNAPLTGDATVEELLSAKVGIKFDIGGYNENNAEDELWGDEPTSATAASGGDKKTKMPMSASVQNHQANTKPYKGSRREKPDVPSEMSRTRLIDRLRDYQLKGEWQQALGVLKTSISRERASNWRGFHYQSLFATFMASNNGNKLGDVWAVMKTVPSFGEGPHDAEIVDRFINVLGRSKSPENRLLLEELSAFVETYNIKLQASAHHYLLINRMQNASWTEALEMIQEDQLREKGEKLDIRHINDMIMKSNSEAATESLLDLADRCGIKKDAGTYAVLLNRNSWEEALQQFSAAVEAGVVAPKAPGNSTLLTKLMNCMDRQGRLTEFKKLERIGGLLPPYTPEMKPTVVDAEGAVVEKEEGEHRVLMSPSILAVQRSMAKWITLRRYQRAINIYQYTTASEAEGGSGDMLVPSREVNSLNMKAVSRLSSVSDRSPPSIREEIPVEQIGLSKRDLKAERIVKEFTNMSRKGHKTTDNVDDVVDLINAFSNQRVQKRRKMFR